MAAGSFAVAADTTPATAAADPVIGMEVLDKLCVARGGTAYNTPLTIARCQEARGKRGFAIEKLICGGLLDGRFGAALSYNHPSRVTWVCSPAASTN